MGLFILPRPNDETVDNYIETAEANIELWKQNKDCDYLIDCFAINNLENAARLIRKQNSTSTESDLEYEREQLEMKLRIEENITAHQSKV